MKRGERAHLILQPEYAYGDAGAEGVPPGSVVEAEVKLDAIHEVTLVAPGVVKKVLEDSSEWRTASEGGRVTIRYRATLPDGTAFDEAAEGAELEVVVDDEAVPEGLDLALMKMKKGERALITISDPKLAYGAAGHAGRLAAVPADAAPLTYDVTLVDLVNPKEKWEMNAAEKAEAAAVAKDKGNAAYKAGKLDRAARMYTSVTDLVGDKDAAADKDKEGGPEVRAQTKELRKSAWLNLAAVELKRGNHREAQKSATKVLDLDPANVKALYRRAQALVGLQELLEAERDVKAALEVEPGSADLAALSKRVKVLIKQLNKKEAGLYKSMFKALGKGTGGAGEAKPADTAADADATAGADQAGAAAAPMEEDGAAAAPGAEAVAAA
ncbi:FK506-binding protein 4/5 [Monoraphidium neglectum]|uniref:peptidylprolyl isomerase n=1 Tax=Monoraphidium neglectum TaxID=145388 RepID=A0A0D2KPG8_9CHLO|nr:FK506-binding protein 4/5 [Monoraphidium neglectum]KIY97518.1 FK506-binding protein 4/5 [Monoraphidium neglectum]|eukprot:XP_013896538.1 FK506-binding protein 4/5 [Monoraphidium neglectum]